MNDERRRNVSKLEKTLQEFGVENGMTPTEVSNVLFDFMYLRNFRVAVFEYGNWWGINVPETDDILEHMYEYQ